MKTIHLPARLLAIANLVPNQAKVADVGTDHGLLPIYLCQIQKVQFAYASDVACNPLNKAKENILKYHLENQIKTILTDGLKNLPTDLDCIMIAGMGGHLIAKIIQESTYTYQTLILQPNSHAEMVRKQLMDLNYQIIEEVMIEEKEKFYPIIKAIHSSPKIVYSEKELTYGPIFLQKKESSFVKMLNQKIQEYKMIQSALQEDSNAFIQINQKIGELQEIIK